MSESKDMVGSFIAETKITEATLDHCFQTQSSLRAYYGSLASQAEMKFNQAKLQFDVKEAALYKQIRDQFAQEGVKTTEKMIEAEVKTHPEWAKLKGEVIEAQCYADITKQLVFSLNDRRDMLIQCGADRRDESKGQLRAMEILRNSENTRLSQLNTMAD